MKDLTKKKYLSTSSLIFSNVRLKWSLVREAAHGKLLPKHNYVLVLYIYLQDRYSPRNGSNEERISPNRSE